MTDPRVERSRELVLQATLELLREIGYGELTIEAIAARSGVAKSTVYRHWPGKLDLVTEAFDQLCNGVDQLPPPGPVRERLISFLSDMTEAVNDPDSPGGCLPALVEAAEHCQEVAAVSSRLVEVRNGPIVRLLDEAVAAGELPADTDTRLLADALVGPILLRRLFHRRAVRPADIPTLVDMVLPVA